MNGDTFNNLNFKDGLKFKKKINAPHIWDAHKTDEIDYGFTGADKNNLVLEFSEKFLKKRLLDIETVVFIYSKIA